MRKVEVVPEQSLVDIIIAILSLGTDSIKLSKKSSITKTELLYVFLSLYLIILYLYTRRSLALSLCNNHELLQQPLTQLSNNHVLVRDCITHTLAHSFSLSLVFIKVSEGKTRYCSIAY